MASSSDGSTFKQVITADPTGFEAAWQRAVKSTVGAASTIHSNVTRIAGVVDAMTDYFKAAAVVIGAGLGVKKLVDEAAAMTESAMDMSRALGITTNEASVARAALEDVGAMPDEFTAAAKGMSKQLKANEEDLKAMGLATRDAAGNLRPMSDLMLDGIGIANSYAEGVDRNIALQTIFGKGVDGTSKLLLVNREAFEENAKAVQELGLEVGANAVAAWQQFDAASDRAALGIRGLVNGIGQALMPVLTDLIQAFNTAMPTAITVLRGALSGLTSAFLYVKNGVVVLWETINATVIMVAEPIRALGEAVGKALVGDFQGAGAAIKAVPTVVMDAWATAFDRMTEMSVETRDRVAALFSADNAVGDGGGTKGTRRAPPGKPDAGKADKTPAAAEPSMMAYYQAALEEEKLAAARSNATREYSLQQEQAYWQNLLQFAQLSGKDRIDISRRVSRIEVDMLRDAAMQGQQIQADNLRAKEAAALDTIAAQQAEAQAAYDIRQITLLELLELERQHELQRAEIRRAALEAQRAMLDPQRDPVEYNRISLELEAAERAHQARMRDIRLSEAVEQAAPLRNMMDIINNGFASMGDSLLSRWKNIGTALQGIFINMGRALIQELILKPLQARVAAFARERLLTLFGIGADAAKAGTGAAAAVAGVPVIGPVLALAAMATVFGAVSKMSSNVPSAAGGFDIPFGTNPLTQLHEREMVLPAKYADVIRSLEEGNTGGAATGPAIVIHGAPDDTVKVRDLGRLLKSMKRDFIITKGDLR